MCLTASFLATGGLISFNYFKMHAWSTCMLFLLHSTFMLSMVKILLKREVGGCAVNCHGITSLIMENRGIVFLNFCGNPVTWNIKPLLVS